jgi:hypothetical protein
VDQTTRYNEAVIRQFTSYVNAQIESCGYTCDCIVNIDKTDIKIVMTGSITFYDEGTKTVSIRTSRLSCSLGGHFVWNLITPIYHLQRRCDWLDLQGKGLSIPEH